MWKRLLHWFIDHSAWDVARWLFAAAGGIAVTTVAQSIYTWWIGHPNDVSLLIGAGTVVIFLIGAFVVSKTQSRSRQRQTEPSRNMVTGAIRDAAQITIESARFGSDMFEVEVTTQVMAMLVDDRYRLPDGRIGIPADGAILLGPTYEDPHEGVQKTLTVRLLKRAHEGKILILPYEQPES